MIPLFILKRVHCFIRGSHRKKFTSRNISIGIKKNKPIEHYLEGTEFCRECGTILKQAYLKKEFHGRFQKSS